MAQDGESSSSSAPSSSKKNIATATDSKSTSSTPDPNAMAIAPYIPPSSLFSDFNLPFDTDDGTANSWNLGNNDGAGGLSFVSGSQLDKKKETTPSGPKINAIADKGGTVKASSDAPSASQISSHIAKNNPFLNKLRRYVLSVSGHIRDG